jgi:hypothetical protein
MRRSEGYVLQGAAHYVFAELGEQNIYLAGILF